MKWETGYIENMKRDKIALLAKALRVSPLWVMGMDEVDYEKLPSNVYPIHRRKLIPFIRHHCSRATYNCRGAGRILGGE